MKRPMMNALKQKWKDFICWFIDNQGYSNLHIEKCEMEFITYYKTNRMILTMVLLNFSLMDFQKVALLLMTIANI